MLSMRRVLAFHSRSRCSLQALSGFEARACLPQCLSASRECFTPPPTGSALRVRASLVLVDSPEQAPVLPLANHSHPRSPAHPPSATPPGDVHQA